MAHTGAWMRGLSAVALGVLSGAAHAQVGACCIADTGACITATQADCVGPINGTWLGTGTTCADDLPCVTTSGACCVEDDCVALTSFFCNFVPESAFAGEGVPCRETQYTMSGLLGSAMVDMQGATRLLTFDDGSGFGDTDEGVGAYTLPADFTYQGVVYPAGSTLNVHTNGFVSFDTLEVTNRPDTPNFRLEFAPDASTPNAAICPLWSDQLSVIVRHAAIVDGNTTTVVLEWDTDPFMPDRWSGRYQLQLVSSTDPTLDGTIRFLYADEPGTLFDSATADDGNVFIGTHSTGGLSVFRPDLATVRDMVTVQGFAGIELTPGATTGACATNACAADFDGNGVVDLTDFGTFGTEFGRGLPGGGPACTAANPCAADFDASGAVDLTDFGTFGAEFGRGLPGGGPSCFE